MAGSRTRTYECHTRRMFTWLDLLDSSVVQPRLASLISSAAGLAYVVLGTAHWLEVTDAAG